MPRAPLTAQQVAAFRARALTVAHRLFQTDGLAGLTARALAAELNVSPMTPYRYFGSREGLVVEEQVEQS